MNESATPAPPASQPAAGSSQEAAEQTIQFVSLYQSQKKIYPRAVAGFFANWRWALVWFTQLLFYGLPWLNWNGRQAVLFDLETRRFYIFELVLYPQDFFYLAVLLVICAYSLFLFTAIAGRLWCGFACPQTVYTEIYMWVERKIEGDRLARMKRDQGPWTFDRAWRAVAKQAAWIAIGLWTGFTLVGYFTPIKELAGSVMSLGTGPWETFWILFYGFATYGNAGYMREQVCKYMCPYARFQSAMFDRDTLIVSYDAERGEPRGSRPKKADPRTLGKGDCIDCTLCVQVCPTGIDIRKGLQYECIGCAACVDVCDSVMDKMSYPRGLIRFATENAMEKHQGRAEIIRHIFRPRVLIYTAILAAICVAFVTSLALRSPFKVDIVRDRGALAQEVDGGDIENVYRLQIMNAAEQSQDYRISVEGLPGLAVHGASRITLGPAQARWMTVEVRLPEEAAEDLGHGSHPFEFIIEREAAPGHEAKQVREKSTFLVPKD